MPKAISSASDATRPNCMNLCINLLEKMVVTSESLNSIEDAWKMSSSSSLQLAGTSQLKQLVQQTKLFRINTHSAAMSGEVSVRTDLERTTNSVYKGSPLKTNNAPRAACLGEAAIALTVIPRAASVNSIGSHG